MALNFLDLDLGWSTPRKYGNLWSLMIDFCCWLGRFCNCYINNYLEYWKPEQLR
jgi:hypothetical protein